MIFLKKFIASGFKSFATKTEITFNETMSGIVGPNGSGKSNVVDAIKWVLGEKSNKILRGKSSEDVIFHGSQGHEQAKTASVTLVFDNSKKFLHYDETDEISITRKITRGTSGNEYFINDEPAKLKDIQEIFLDTGLSRDSLGIISQGTVQWFAEAKAEERRKIFEEAAGIGLYTKRKQEAENQLARVTENLEKIVTITDELALDVKKLSKQAEKAKEYGNLRKQLMQLDLTISVKDLIYYQRTLTTINNELIKSKDDLKTFEPEEHQINETLKLLKKNLEDADEEVENCNIELNKINDEINKLEITKSSIKASLQNDLTGTNIEKKISAYQDLISSIKFDITNAEENVKKFNDEIEIYSEVITNSLKQKQTLEDDIRTKDNQLASIRSEINVLQQMSSNRDYTQNAQRIIIENKRALTGICGMVKEFISVDEKYEKAISIALGGSVNDIVTELTSDAEEAVNFLKSNRVGRATFLPLDAIKPREIKDEFKTVIETLPGFIGIANTLVKYANKYDNLFRNLLGSVIIANEINDATTISKYTYKMYRIVTLDGDIISPGGAITGGFNRANSLAINPEKRIKLLDENFTAISSELTTARINLEKINSEYQENENKQNERKILLDRYENIIKMNQNDLYKFEIEYEQLKQATGKGKNNKKDNNEENTLEKKIASLNTKKEKINVNLNVSRQNKTINKSRVEDLESKLNEVRTQKDKNRDVMFEQEKNKSKCEMAIENIREKINKNYKMTIEYATENYQSELPMSEQQARETIEKLEDEMERLGSINFDAVGELEEKQERYEKLSSQRSELEKAHNNINSTIMELDKKAKHDFSNIIEKTNASLIDIFKFLFGGGKCQLEYTNPDDILTSGIEVIATPPGKNTAHLNLLSGGEKSLVALSILFAILKNKTFPLVILDEAESALDPANVERFGNIIHRNSELTQFIVITHRAGTMERCDCLFGATMQTRGITSVYKISLSQAKNTIDEINEEDTTKKENKKKK